MPSLAVHEVAERHEAVDMADLLVRQEAHGPELSNVASTVK